MGITDETRTGETRDGAIDESGRDPVDGTAGPREEEGTRRAAGDPDVAESGTGPEGYGDGTHLPSLRHLTGMTVRDRAGEKVGRVSDIYLDGSGRHVRYLAVRGGPLFGRRRHLVPVDDVTQATREDGRAYLAIPYMKDQVRSGPNVSARHEMTPEVESSVSGYYRRIGHWDRAREILTARQATPAPTPRIAEAELTDAISRGRAPEDVASTRVRRWRS